MPRIRALTSIAGPRFDWQEGDVVDVDEATAAVWADGVRAVRVNDEETAMRRAPENAARRTGRPRGR